MHQADVSMFLILFFWSLGSAIICSIYMGFNDIKETTEIPEDVKTSILIWPFVFVFIIFKYLIVKPFHWTFWYLGYGIKQIKK